jgi:hypothetical protein
MDSSWKDLLVLLHGNEKTALLAATLLSESATKHDLPDIFHSLCCSPCDYLCAKQWEVRRNSANALHSLVSTHREVILDQLRSFVQSDGALLRIADMNIEAILSKGFKPLLSGESFDSISHLTDDLYQKSWLSRQRKQLVKRLGLSIGDKDVGSALSHDDTAMIIEEIDVVLEPGSSTEKSSGKIETIDDLTTESWLVRIIRLLTVGILDPRWEIRHGYCYGLSRIILGIGSAIESALPRAVLEDMICSCIYALLLDRFIDIDAEGSNIIAPVKEMAGQLIAMSSSFLSADATYQISDILLLMSDHEEWSVQYGGLIALKYWTASKYKTMTSRFMIKVFNCIQLRLSEGVDDVKHASVQVLESCSKITEDWLRTTCTPSITLKQIESNHITSSSVNQLVCLMKNIISTMKYQVNSLSTSLALSLSQALKIVKALLAHLDDSDYPLVIGIYCIGLDILAERLLYRIHHSAGLALLVEEIPMNRKILQMVNDFLVDKGNNFESCYSELGSLLEKLRRYVIALLMMISSSQLSSTIPDTDTALDPNKPPNSHTIIYYDVAKSFESLGQDIGCLFPEIVSKMKSRIDRECESYFDEILTSIFEHRMDRRQKIFIDIFSERITMINSNGTSLYSQLEATSMGFCWTNYCIAGIIYQLSVQQSNLVAKTRTKLAQAMDKITEDIRNHHRTDDTPAMKRPRFVFVGMPTIVTNNNDLTSQDSARRVLRALVCLWIRTTFLLCSTSGMIEIGEARLSNPVLSDLRALIGSLSFEGIVNTYLKTDFESAVANDLGLLVITGLLNHYHRHSDHQEQYVCGLINALR